MPPEHRILALFDEQLRPGEQHAESTLGESIDELLGSVPDAGPPAPAAAVTAAGASASWRAQPASYGSVAERQLQGLCDRCLAWLRSNVGVSDALRSDDICLRIVTGVSASPFTRLLADCHYIVLSVGYLKSLENLFRTQEQLAVLGAALRLRQPDARLEARRHVHSNAIGGADAQYALQAGTRVVHAILAALFDDALVWSSSDRPYSYPEALLTVMARVSYEMQVGGMYASEGIPDDVFRPAATARSRALTRLVAAYALCHELAHIVLRAEGDGTAPGDPHAAGSADALESRCDLVATLYTPLFVQAFSTAWQLQINGGIEYVAGLLGFFMAAEVLAKAQLHVGLVSKTFKPGDASCAAIAQNLAVIALRRQRQLRVLRKLDGDEPARLHMLDLAQAEFMVLPIAVDMRAEQFQTHRRADFHAHWNRHVGGSARA